LARKDAAHHFIQQIEAIADNALDSETPIVSIILDGENAWEYYPYNGHYFLEELYTMLESSTRIRMTTYSEYIDPTLCGQNRIMPVCIILPKSSQVAGFTVIFQPG